jgi:nucleoside-diphosphate-sugar epimerase
MSRFSVYGSNGFIGNRFCQMFPADVVRIGRNVRTPYTPESLYLISTVDNYNVHTDLQIDIDTNLKVLMETLDAFKHEKFKTEPVFNFVSSWFVYGQNNEIPFREDYSHCNPTGFYSITKRCAEQMLICWCNTFGYKYRIFRLANVIGEGDNKISKKKNALQYMVKEIVNGRDVDLYYGGEVLRDYIYVDDVCSAMKLCMDKAPTNQIYNIGSGIPLRFLDIINKTIDMADSPSKINHIEPTNFHNIVQVRHSYLDTTKIKELGFVQQYDIDATLKRLIEHYTLEELWQTKKTS